MAKVGAYAKQVQIEKAKEAELEARFATMTEAALATELLEAMNELDMMFIERRISRSEQQERWFAIRFEALDRRVIAARTELRRRQG